MGVEPSHQCVEHFRNWLERKMSGCRFASELSAGAAIAYQLVPPDLSREELPAVAKFIDESAVKHLSAILLLPHVRSDEQISRVLGVLAADPRWSVSRVEWGSACPESVRADRVLVGVEWKTTDGDASSAMGFAPLGTMPVTRRAPYFALALWAGGHENPYKKTPGKRVGFIDAAHSLPKPKHDKRWTDTEEAVGRLLADPPEDRQLLRKVAFCLDANAVADLLHARP